MTKSAIITGITGQDGSYLADLLLEKDYKVIGLYRRSSTVNFGRISHILHHPNLILEESDLTDPSSCNRVINQYKPNEFYNLAAQSHVGTSFTQPIITFEINSVAVLNMLESIKSYSPTTRFYQASTSEMFGFNYSVNDLGKRFQDEKTPFMPQSPYGVAKLAAHHSVRIYRSYGIHGSCGILFNHESPRRGENFVTRKITKYIGQVVNNKTSEKLKLGNLSAQRDWGHAKDYVRAMWLMLQQTNPDDYVICTGNSWSVQDFLEQAFSYVNLDYKDYVEIDHNLFRPAEVDYLRGSSVKARDNLGWSPSVTFVNLVKDMVDNDVQTLR